MFRDKSECFPYCPKKQQPLLCLQQRYQKPYRTCGDRKEVRKVVTHSLELLITRIFLRLEPSFITAPRSAFVRKLASQVTSVCSASYCPARRGLARSSILKP